MDLLPTPVTECNKQRAGALFTVRSANSPSYSLTRRPGVRGAKGFSVEQKEDTEEDGKRERYGTNTNVSNEEDDRVAGHQARTGCRSSVTDQCEEKVTPGHDKSPKLNQNGIGDKLTTGTGSEVPVKSENPAFESRDSAESRRSNWQSRSKSLDWRTGRTNADKGGEDLKKQIGGLDGRQSAAEGVSGRVMFSRQTYNSVGTRDVTRERSPGRHMSQTLDRTSRGRSLPSRFRPQSSSGSTTSEPTGGQSIMERIEKLYVSAGFGKDESCSKVKDPITTTDTPRSYERAAGATLPRERSKKSITWASQTVSETFSPERSRRLSGDDCQGKIQGSHPEDSGVNWRKGFTEVGTKSLDRARNRNTKAANIRETRAQDETNGINWAKETDEMKGGSTDDVFESNPKNDTLKTTDKKKFSEMPSAASVRNKISQFEALTQRAQGLATGQALMHRRAMSVPTHLNKGHDGVKKSGSAKAIDGLKDKWAGMKEGGEMDEEKVTAAGKKAVSERSLSLDEVGLKSRRKEDSGEDLVDTEGKSNDGTEDFGKHSRLKGTLEIPLNGGAQRRRNFYIDETDFSKLSSPEESSEKNNSVPSSPLSNPNHTSTSVQKISPTVITSPVSDDDKTPTNTPDHSPFHSPSTQLENTSPATQGHDRASVIIQEAKTHDPDSSPVPRPLATSSHSNLPDLISPDVKTVNHKGKKQPLDLDAWVASLKSDVKVWNDNEDDEDDEDDDDDSTQKDEDSNYDSDSGESSVTITSNMSQSDRRSFSVSLSDLCNFAGVDYESENDSDEWQLVTGRTASLSSDVSALSYVSVMPTEELDRLLEDVRSLGDNTLQDYDDVHVVVLHKEVGVGLGFSVAGGVDQNKPVTVHKIFHSGVAAQEGSMREGDQVLSINGTAFQNYAHWEVLRVLRRSKSREMAVVVLRRGGLDDASKTGVPTSNQAPTQTELTETGQQMCVRLEKNNRDLGFSLEGGVGSSLGNRPLTVQKIFQGGPVDKVCPGDEVMEIEGVSVVGMRRLEAWTLIRKLPSGPVDVVLRRPLKHLET